MAIKLLSHKRGEYSSPPSAAAQQHGPCNSWRLCLGRCIYVAHCGLASVPFRFYAHGVWRLMAAAPVDNAISGPIGPVLARPQYTQHDVRCCCCLVVLFNIDAIRQFLSSTPLTVCANGGRYDKRRCSAVRNDIEY